MKTHALNAPAALVSPDVESARIRRGTNLTEAYAALLDAIASMPLESGPSAVARRLLDCLASVLPDRALGVCLVLPDGMPAPGRDPTRLFPELDGERVIELDGLPGSTLHAAPCGVSLDEEPVERAVLQRAAAAMAASIRSAMVLRAAKPVSVEMT